MNQGERVKELRKALNMTLEIFGERLGVTKTAISRIEKGERNLTDQMSKSICREFNVNEEWLRSGEGDMFLKQEYNGMDEFLKSKGASELEMRILKAYFELDKDMRHEALEHFKKHLSEHDSLPVPDPVAEAEIEYIKSRSNTAAGTDLYALNTGEDIKEA